MPTTRQRGGSPPALPPGSWKRRTTFPILNPRRRSLVRGNVLVFGGLGVALLISHAPHLQPSLWLILPLLTCMAGMADTLRCMQPRWNFYHGGVLLCVYMDLMVITLVLFFLVYPYFSG